AAAVSLGRLVGPWHRPVLRGLQPRLAPLAARGARRPRAFGAGGAGARDRGAGQRGVPRCGRPGGRFVVRDPVAQVAGRAAGAGGPRPLPELGADFARDGAAARGPGRPAAVAAAGGGVRAGRMAVRPPDRAARVGGPGAQPGRHLPGQPEGTFAAAGAADLSCNSSLELLDDRGFFGPDAWGGFADE